MKTESTADIVNLAIANLALKKLNKPAIKKFDAFGTATERLVSMHFHAVRREILISTPWKFATEEATIITTGESCMEGVDGYHRFPLPWNCLNVVNVETDSEWVQRGRAIFTKEPLDAINVTYTRDEEDCALFTSDFVECFATRLACKLALPLTMSPTEMKRMRDIYTLLLAEREPATI